MDDFAKTHKILGISEKIASNNLTMMNFEDYFSGNYPADGFSADWNQIKCMAHVLNLTVKGISTEFQEPVDADQIIMNA